MGVAFVWANCARKGQCHEKQDELEVNGEKEWSINQACTMGMEHK